MVALLGNSLGLLRPTLACSFSAADVYAVSRVDAATKSTVPE
jgi:hypothetical protein